MEVRPEVGGRNSPHAAATSIRLLGLGHRCRPPTVKPTYFGLATLALFLFAFLVLISNNIAQAQTSTNTPPEFTNATVDRSVPENSPPGRSIGEPVAATDAENDLLTYGISGADASVFGIDRLNGQITAEGGGPWTTKLGAFRRYRSWRPEWRTRGRRGDCTRLSVCGQDWQ